MPFALSVSELASKSHSVCEPPPGLGVLVLDAVPASELLYPSGRIDEFLLTGKERVAFGADLDVDRRDRGARLDHVAARADDLRRFVVWVDAFFHKNLRRNL